MSEIAMRMSYDTQGPTGSLRRRRWLRPLARLLAVVFIANVVLSVALFSMDDMSTVEMFFVSIASAIAAGLLWEAVD